MNQIHEAVLGNAPQRFIDVYSEQKQSVNTATQPSATLTAAQNDLSICQMCLLVLVVERTKPGILPEHCRQESRMGATPRLYTRGTPMWTCHRVETRLLTKLKSLARTSKQYSVSNPNAQLSVQGNKKRDVCKSYQTRGLHSVAERMCRGSSGASFIVLVGRHSFSGSMCCWCNGSMLCELCSPHQRTGWIMFCDCSDSLLSVLSRFCDCNAR